ncbi:MAG: ORF6N domain-containing protein [Ruminococcus sp.]|nr:ORF6N domain-containing protein [Ruminococcus sp.]
MNDFKITPIEQEGQRVLTTAQLAKAYGTTSKVISNNFNRNKDRYIEGKHFYRLTGEEKREFCNRHQIEDGSKATDFYLWAERGSLLHAKSLNTDKAWEVYDFLVDTYFRAKEMNKYYNENIYQKLEVLEQKIDTLEKSITENSYSTVQTLIPCFEIMYKKLNKLYNKLTK